jgi:membrane-associated protein
MPVSPLHSSVASSTKSLVSAHLRHFSNHYIVTPVGLFISWLAVHTHIAYLVLFLGAYFEALIGPSFFIPGELFLLSGSILAGAHVLNIWLVCFALYAGAILGDSSSYWIGRIIGTSLFHERKKFFNMKNYHKAESFLQKYGPQAIFLARLVGPFAKIAPVAAGMFEIPFGTFLAYNIPGVIIGVGEFIVAGYFFGNRYQLVLLLIERYSVLFFMILGLGIFFHWYLRRHFKKRHAKKSLHHPSTAEKKDSV